MKLGMAGAERGVVLSSEENVEEQRLWLEVES